MMFKIQKLVPVFAKMIATLFMAIGLFMTLQAAGQGVLLEPNLSYVHEGCDFRYDLEKAQDIKLEDEEKEECVKARTDQEKHFFYNKIYRDGITGVSLLIVSGVFWSIFRKKKNKK